MSNTSLIPTEVDISIEGYLLFVNIIQPIPFGFRSMPKQNAWFCFVVKLPSLIFWNMCVSLAAKDPKM